MELFRTHDIVAGQRIAYVLFCIIAVCTILYFGQTVIAPIAVAAYLAMLLSIPVFRLQQYGLPKALAVALVVTLAGVIMATGILVLFDGMAELADEWPTYAETIRKKVELLINSFGLSGAIHGPLTSALSSVPGKGAASSWFGTNMGDAAVAAVPSVVHALVQFGIVMLLVMFFLFFREDLRNRFISTVSPVEIGRTTAAMTETVKRLVRLFATQVMLNIAAGATTGIALLLLGVPQAAFWGLLTAIMRFVPYLGPILAAALPIITAAATTDGWTAALSVMAIILVIEITYGQIIEPMFFGSTTGLSPIAIVISAIIWTALWGTTGLFLSMPLTIALSIAGRHIPGLSMIDKILARDPGLDPELRLYQRLLAGDLIEAAIISEVEIERIGAARFLSETAVPALAFCCRDHRNGGIDRDQVINAIDQFRVLSHELFPPAEGGKGVKLVHSGLFEDRAAAVAFSTALSARSIAHLLMDQSLQQALSMPDGEPVTVVLCFMETPSEPKLRYFERRLKMHWPKANQIAMAWHADDALSSVLRSEGATLRLLELDAARLPADPLLIRDRAVGEMLDGLEVQEGFA